MKNKKAFELIINITILTFLFAANVYSQEGSIADETGNYEYMSIVTRQYDGSTSRIYISMPNGQYEEIKFDILDEKTSFDFSRIHEIIEKLDKEGWEIVSSNMVNGFSDDTKIEKFYTYYFLKRKK